MLMKVKPNKCIFIGILIKLSDGNGLMLMLFIFSFRFEITIKQNQYLFIKATF